MRVIAPQKQPLGLNFRPMNPHKKQNQSRHEKKNIEGSKGKITKTGKKILFLGHNDTVFPPNSFEGFSQDETWVYGPGACDMKGGNIVALQALRNIFEQNGEIFNIDFLLVSDEETGSDDSKEITKSIANNYDYCFVFEAAGEKYEGVTQR